MKTSVMRKEKIYSPNYEISGNTSNSHVKIYETLAGPLFLRSCCSPTFVENLKVDEGLRAFARLPEREHQQLLSIARHPGNRLPLADSATGIIVGHSAFVPLDHGRRDTGS